MRVMPKGWSSRDNEKEEKKVEEQHGERVPVRVCIHFTVKMAEIYIDKCFLYGWTMLLR